MVRTATKPDRGKLDRAEVIAAALDLVVREGPAALSMRRLATELDVATPTIYWHVGNRDELVAAVIRHQADRLAQQSIQGRTRRERVLSAALHIYSGALEQRPITSLAHQTGTTSLLLHQLEVALVDELEAAGVAGEALDTARRSILLVVTGALVLALRDWDGLPDGRDDGLWAGCDIDLLTMETLRAVVAHHVTDEELL